MKILRCFFPLVHICVLAIILSGVAGDCNTTFEESPSTDAEVDPRPPTPPPTVTGSTIKDGEEDVDYEKINEGKTIEITFSKEVSGVIVLRTEDGNFVGWIGKVEGMKGTLELVAGKELSSQITYIIKCIVVDSDHNELEVSINFTTKDKA